MESSAPQYPPIPPLPSHYDRIAPVRALYIREVPGKGRGVFSSEAIKAGEIFEVCPVIELPEADVEPMQRTEIKNYSFDWPESFGKGRACALGYGMLYNHSYEPNARYIRNAEARAIVYMALRDIQPYEEILISYNGDPSDKAPISSSYGAA